MRKYDKYSSENITWVKTLRACISQNKAKKVLKESSCFVVSKYGPIDVDFNPILTKLLP